MKTGVLYDGDNGRIVLSFFVNSDAPVCCLQPVRARNQCEIEGIFCDISGGGGGGGGGEAGQDRGGREKIQIGILEESEWNPT